MLQPEADAESRAGRAKHHRNRHGRGHEVEQSLDAQLADSAPWSYAMAARAASLITSWRAFDRLAHVVPVGGQRADRESRRSVATAPPADLLSAVSTNADSDRHADDENQEALCRL
jgi:hypothetical protein